MAVLLCCAACSGSEGSHASSSASDASLGQGGPTFFVPTDPNARFTCDSLRFDLDLTYASIDRSASGASSFELILLYADKPDPGFAGRVVATTKDGMTTGTVAREGRTLVIDYYNGKAKPGPPSQVSWKTDRASVTLSTRSAHSFDEVAALSDQVVPVDRADFLDACAKGGFDPPILTAGEDARVMTYGHGLATVEEVTFNGQLYSVTVSARLRSTDPNIAALKDGEISAGSWEADPSATVMKRGTSWVVITADPRSPAGTGPNGTSATTMSAVLAAARQLRDATAEELPRLFTAD